MNGLQRNKSTVLCSMLFILSVFGLPVFARTQKLNNITPGFLSLETRPRLHGTVEDIGTYFEVTDNGYLNIALTSNEPVHLTLESVPKMITMGIAAAAGSETIAPNRPRPATATR